MGGFMCILWEYGDIRVDMGSGYNGIDNQQKLRKLRIRSKSVTFLWGFSVCGNMLWNFLWGGNCLVILSGYATGYATNNSTIIV